MHRFLDFTLDGLTFGMVYASVAMALVLIWRGTRIVNFAQGAMAMVTTYLAVSLIDRHISYWIAFVVALVAGLVLGALVEVTLVRPVENKSPLVAVIVTLGLLVALEAIAALIWGGRFRSFTAPFSIVGLKVGQSQIALSPFDIFTICAVLVVMLGLLVLFHRTATGLRMRASAFEPEVARLLGVRVGRVLTLGWALAAVAGSLAGLLVAPKLFLYPNNMDAVLVFGFTAAILGGLDSPVGALVGGLAIGLSLSYVGGYLGSDTETIGAFVILIAVLMVRPGGIFTRVNPRRV
ncbi:MAG TPA: branched-chain amino acid ABC transporter permease [Acidimicrobiales bacterium]|nr:branched-chain amino acid ABC transporter permease [Acidimicrobiales bacterium]